MPTNTTHHFVIDPLKGVGPIRFGMHKDEVSHVFTYVYTSFFKQQDSPVRSDDCEVVGLIIHYDTARQEGGRAQTQRRLGTLVVRSLAAAAINSEGIDEQASSEPALITT